MKRSTQSVAFSSLVAIWPSSVYPSFLGMVYVAALELTTKVWKSFNLILIRVTSNLRFLFFLLPHSSPDTCAVVLESPEEKDVHCRQVDNCKDRCCDAYLHEADLAKSLELEKDTGHYKVAKFN